MIVKDKMFLIASGVDDSIKSQSIVHDIKLFKSYLDFEAHVDRVPDIIETLVLTSNELQFTNANMTRILQLLETSFIQVKGNIIYLIDETYDIDMVRDFFNKRGITDWVIYQGDLSYRFIADVISGEIRDEEEGQTDIVTYRVRARDYARMQQMEQYESDVNRYYTDEEELGGVPDVEEPEASIIGTNASMKVEYVVGDDTIERTLLSFIIAQYHSLSGKTVIVEKDIDYHRLTELATKSGVDMELILMDELSNDASRVLQRIISSSQRLIVLGCIKRMKYDYKFVVDFLAANLREAISYLVCEYDFEETPYGCPYIIVARNNIPDALKACNSIKYDIKEGDNVIFIGMQLGDLGSVNLSKDELEAVISKVLEKNNLNVQVMEACGILLKGEESVYDILSIVSRTN